MSSTQTKSAKTSVASTKATKQTETPVPVSAPTTPAVSVAPSSAPVVAKGKKTATKSVESTPSASTTPAVEVAPASASSPTSTSSPASTPASTESSSSVSGQCEAMVAALMAMGKQVKDMQTQVRNLQRQVVREYRDLEKASKSNRRTRKNKQAPVEGGVAKPKRAPSGFAKPARLSKELCKFLGVSDNTELARTEVTRSITKYIKEHNLQNPEHKKEIVPDAKLTALLKIPKGEKLTFFNLQRYMKDHFQKIETVPVSAPAVQVSA